MTTSGTQTEIYLLGHGALGQFLDFIDDAVIKGTDFDLASLTAEWRAAIEYYQHLETREAGIALQGSHRALDPAYQPWAAQLQSLPEFRHTFDIVPTTFGMVELDRLIVSQRSVTREHIESLRASVAPTPDAAAIFRLCHPVDAPLPPVTAQRLGSRRFVFSCNSSNLRAAGVSLLPAGAPDHASHVPFGVGGAGVRVGFGTNFLNVVRVGRRHLLSNGYHRALALRALGVTHVPCVIQSASHVDELRLTVGDRVADDPEYYLESARPPLLGDFADPRLARHLPIRKMVRRITIDVEVRESFAYE